MKALVLLATTLVLSAAPTVWSQEEHSHKYFSPESSYANVNISFVQEGFCRCLDSDNDGVVESALAHLVKMKLLILSVPEGKAEQRFETLAVNGRTPAIRFKAYIASQVYANPRLFAPVRRMEFQEADGLFTALAERLQTSLISENAK